MGLIPHCFERPTLEDAFYFISKFKVQLCAFPLKYLHIVRMGTVVILHREFEFAKMLAPYEKPIGIVGAFRSVSTPLFGINREIYMVKSNASITSDVRI